MTGSATTAGGGPLDPFERGDQPLRAAAALLRCLIDAMHAMPMELPEGVPNVAAAHERLHARLPALTGEPLIDAPTLRSNARFLLERLAGREGEPGRTARALLETLSAAETAVDWQALSACAVAGEWQAALATGTLHGPHARALVEVLEWSVRPALRAGAARLNELFREPARETGRCPCCGTLPGLAELRPDGGGATRVLRCLRCATAWPFASLGCPQCGERDHRNLSYVHGEGEFAHRRLQWCATCRFYVKELATLDAVDADRLLEMDLVTSALDQVARSRALWH